MTNEEIQKQQAKLLDPQAEGSQPSASSMHMHASAEVTTSTVAPETGGQWSDLPPLPESFNAIHSIAGKNGKFLLIAGSGNSRNAFLAGTFKTYVWVPTTGERREVPTPEDLFCAGHVLLPDGRALVVGGTTSYSPYKGAKALYAFNFTTEEYEKLTPMQVGRWYPSVITAPDGRSIIVSGIDENGAGTKINEVFDYHTNTISVIPGQKQFPLYPHIVLAANGKYFYTGAGSGPSTLAPGFWQPFADNAYQPITGLRVPTQRGAAASCFVGDVRNQRLMVMGGGWPATDYTDVVKLNTSTPAYEPGPSLRAAKAYLSCVNLPDGTLFEANGGAGNTIPLASNEAGILESHTQEWQEADSLPDGEHRVYHSMLFLLDDGRVISMSSNPNGAARSTSILAYSPPYLFKGTRPIIKAAPTDVKYGASYSVSAKAKNAHVKKYAITTPPSPTHSSEPNQRYLLLQADDRDKIAVSKLPNILSLWSDDQGKITIPRSPNILPPGWYRIWAVDTAGRVSEARWIRLSL